MRTALTANTSFYVSPSGSDSNDGLSPTTPWLTIQYALNTVHDQYDLAGYSATIQLADGTYAPPAGSMAGFVTGCFVGDGGSPSVIVQGDQSNPAAVVVSTTNNHCFAATERATFQVNFMTLETAGSGGACLYADWTGALIASEGCNFGPSGAFHMWASGGAQIVASSVSFALTGSPAWGCLQADTQGAVTIDSSTIAVANNLNFPTFATAETLGYIFASEASFTGGANVTGMRYNVTSNAVITAGGNPTLFPGNAPGGTSNGGQYQ